MIFSVVKLDLWIQELLPDRILALENTMRTPRVHLVMFMNILFMNIRSQEQYVVLYFLLKYCNLRHTPRSQI